MSDKTFKNIVWFGLASLFIFAPLARGAARLWSITPIEIVVLSLCFIWFRRMNNTTGWNFKPTALDAPIWAFLALASLSCIFSIYLHDSLYGMRRLLAMAGIYYLIVNNFDKKRSEQLMMLIVIVGAGISLFGLAQYFFNLSHGWWAEERFLTSTYVNHNHFAGYLELAMPLAFGFFFSEKTVLRKAGFGIAAVIMSAAFLFAQSRGAWILIAVSAVLSAFYLSRKGIVRKSAFVILLLALSFIFAALYCVKGDISERLGTMTNVGGEASFLCRLKIWEGTIDMIKNNPAIGTGIGTFLWGFPRYRPEGLNYKISHAHNDYLHMAAEMGILAMALMILMAVIVMKKSFSLAARPVYACITVGLLSLFLHSLIDFNFHIPANMMLVTAMSAIIMSEK